MAKTNQNDTFYAKNTRVLEFTITDDENEDAPSAPLDLTGCTVQWALSRINSSGSYSSTPVLRKDSALLGGVVIDSDPSTGVVRVNIDPDDTEDLVGKFYQELEVVDSTNNPVVVATGTLTIKRNVRNTA